LTKQDKNGVILILLLALNPLVRDIFDRYDKLIKIFDDENSDIKKAEQSLFLIETNLNNIQVNSSNQKILISNDC